MKKKIKWWTFLFPIAFLSLSALILFEGATPGNESSVQSKWFASVFDRGEENATLVLPTSLSMEKEEYSLYLGEQLQLNPAFSPSQTSDKRVSYKIISSPEVVSIEENSLTGLAQGVARIEAISEANPSLKAEFSVKVEKEKIKNLFLSLSSSNLVKGMTSKLAFSSNKKETSLEEVGFSSSNPDVAYVDSLGYVHGVSVGETTLTCFGIEDASIVSSPCILTVEDGEFIPTESMEYQSEISLFVGEGKRLEPVFNPGCSDTAFYLSSSPDSIGFEDGVLIPKEEGDYALEIASVNNPSVACSFTVHAIEVKPISISVSFSSLQYGKTEKLQYALQSEKEGLSVTHPEVSFHSSDTDIASVDENGYLLGFKKGSVDITVSWDKNPSIKGKATIAITSMDGERFDNINYIVRKAIGHFGSFCLTAAFAVLTCFFFFKRRTPFFLSLAISLVYGLILAMLSEFLQIFAGSRGPSWNDVGIDFLGYFVGFALTFAIAFAIYRTLSKRRSVPASKEIE